jgi:hypothetical protein
MNNSNVNARVCLRAAVAALAVMATLAANATNIVVTSLADPGTAPPARCARPSVRPIPTWLSVPARRARPPEIRSTLLSWA